MLAFHPDSLATYDFHPVLHLPSGYRVLDFTAPNRNALSGDPGSPFSIGRYDEDRRGMYTAELFQGSEPRTVHMGIDLGGPVGTEIYAPWEGEIFDQRYHPEAGNYGGTLVLRFEFGATTLFALFGHIAKASLTKRAVGAKVMRGDCIAWIGDESENGGWPPHLHFQISTVEPKDCDMPGVVAASQRETALLIYPDPRCLLGKLY